MPSSALVLGDLLHRAQTALAQGRLDAAIELLRRAQVRVAALSEHVAGSHEQYAATALERMSAAGGPREAAANTALASRAGA